MLKSVTFGSFHILRTGDSSVLMAIPTGNETVEAFARKSHPILDILIVDGEEKQVLDNIDSLGKGYSEIKAFKDAKAYLLDGIACVAKAKDLVTNVTDLKHFEQLKNEIPLLKKLMDTTASVVKTVK